MKEFTLSIIKPDAVNLNIIGQIYTRFEENGLWIVQAKMLTMDVGMAKEFYKIHADKPFFMDLVKYMTSGPSMIQVLYGENAVNKHRNLMGATNPEEARPGTIRYDFGKNLDANAVHGSDSLLTAKEEIEFFFGEI